MDLQLNLKQEEKSWESEHSDLEKTAKWFGINIWEKWIYQQAFGWGVRMKNIALTSILFVFSFTVIYFLINNFPW